VGVPCHQPACGDGFVDFIIGAGNGNTGGTGSGSGGSGSGGFAGGPNGAFEACDDGNTVPGDGCDSACSVEAGWFCSNWADPCHLTVCGDGFTDYPAEECDDGNTQPNDGCSQSCGWEYQGGGGSGGGFGVGGFSAGGVGGAVVPSPGGSGGFGPG
jgi:cysteine-rich repeat protein